jgi:hypothetical protein
MYVMVVSEALIDTGVRQAIAAVVGEKLVRTIRMGPFRLRFGKDAKRGHWPILDLRPMPTIETCHGRAAKRDPAIH